MAVTPVASIPWVTSSAVAAEVKPEEPGFLNQPHIQLIDSLFGYLVLSNWYWEEDRIITNFEKKKKKTLWSKESTRR